MLDLESLTNEGFLSYLVKSNEERYIYYKKELQDSFKNGLFKDGNNLWWKEFLKDGEKEALHNVKLYGEELSYYRSGLNSPCCYPFDNSYYNKSKINLVD
jgi:hypothetical protein